MIPPSLPALAVSFFAGGGIPIGAMPLICTWPNSRFWGPVISRGPVNDRAEIALTFDDGPDGEYTPRILDALGEHAMCATFFVIGRNVERFRRSSNACIGKVISWAITRGITTITGTSEMPATGACRSAEPTRQFGRSSFARRHGFVLRWACAPDT